VGIFLMHEHIEFVTQGIIVLKSGEGIHRVFFTANRVPSLSDPKMMKKGAWPSRP
jgi:hypothetical protein